jgi:hypothetical protein
MRTELPGQVTGRLEGRPGGWRPGIRRPLAPNVGRATRALTGFELMAGSQQRLSLR